MYFFLTTCYLTFRLFLNKVNTNGINHRYKPIRNTRIEVRLFDKKDHYLCLFFKKLINALEKKENFRETKQIDHELFLFIY